MPVWKRVHAEMVFIGWPAYGLHLRNLQIAADVVVLEHLRLSEGRFDPGVLGSLQQLVDLRPATAFGGEQKRKRVVQPLVRNVGQLQRQLCVADPPVAALVKHVHVFQSQGFQQDHSQREQVGEVQIVGTNQSIIVQDLLRRGVAVSSQTEGRLAPSPQQPRIPNHY